MSTERKNWLTSLNPCGGQPAEGFEMKRCFPACEQTKALCLSSGAFQIVGYLINGSSVTTERQDFKDFLRGSVGRIIVDLNGNAIRLTRENFDFLLEATVERAKNLLELIDQCIENTFPLTDDYLCECTDDQHGVLDRIFELNKLARKLTGTDEQAEQLVQEMRETLQKAIDLDLDEFGLIVRQAISYGLGERVLTKRGISTGLIPKKIGRIRRLS